jgi:hypothetical protein
MPATQIELRDWQYAAVNINEDDQVTIDSPHEWGNEVWT